MNPLETIHTALMALRAHKLRSGLTALGHHHRDFGNDRDAGCRRRCPCAGCCPGPESRIQPADRCLGQRQPIGCQARRGCDADTYGRGCCDNRSGNLLRSGDVLARSAAKFRSWRKPLTGQQPLLRWILAISKCGIGQWKAAARLKQTKRRTVPRSRFWDRRSRNNYFLTLIRSGVRSGSGTCRSELSECSPRKASPPQGKIRMMRLLFL